MQWPPGSHPNLEQGWAERKAYTGGTPRLHPNPAADSEAKLPAQLGPGLHFSSFKMGAKRFYQMPQGLERPPTPVVSAKAPHLPSGNTVSPGWTPSDPHLPRFQREKRRRRGLGGRRPQR